MIADLAFDFTADKATNTVHMIKEFAAGCSLVWDAFTKCELLDQWGAPQPWTAHTKWMNFEVGGSRLYAMRSPEGLEHWSIQEFTFIDPISRFSMRTNFTDKDGNLTSGFPGSDNSLEFTESNGITTVRITIEYANAEALQMMIEKGFKEGTTMAMTNLDTLIKTLSK